MVGTFWGKAMISAAVRMGKQVIRSRINSWGWEVGRRRVATNGSPLPLLRLVMEHAILRGGPGTVLQVGANTGDDALHQIIVDLQLPALLIEPLPDIFEILKQSYAGKDYVEFENCAVSTQPGELKMYRVSRAATHLPSWTQALASFDKSLVLSHKGWEGVSGKELEKYIEEVNIKVKTMQELLSEHPKIVNVIALQVDTEGHDFEVIKSTLAAQCSPKIILFEHKHLSFDDQASCRRLLSENGYSFSSDASDTLAYRVDPAATYPAA